MRRCVFFVLIVCAGCDVLFPELAGKAQPMDAASNVDGGGTPQLAGLLCMLGDVRDPRNCATGLPSGMHVSVEETRDAANVDATGNFTLPLSAVLDNATLAAADPTGSFKPTVTSVHLANGRAVGLAVPMMRADVLQSIAAQNNLLLDPKRGTLLAWAADAHGSAIAGVTATAPAGSSGAFYEGPEASEVLPGRATGTHGLIAIFNIPPGDAPLTVAGVTFKLPVRADAVTLAVLLLTAP